MQIYIATVAGKINNLVSDRNITERYIEHFVIVLHSCNINNILVVAWVLNQQAAKIPCRYSYCG